jgi:hypothetical protein
MAKARAGETALSGSNGSERLALFGAQSSCRADRFFVTAGAFTLSLNMGLCNCFFRWLELAPQKRESDELV